MEKWCVLELNNLYSVSNFGNIKNNITGYIRKPHVTLRGYKTLTISINGIRTYPFIHRLVALCFIANPENKPEVNHKDGDKGNNHDWNLEWVTRSENQLHAYSVLGKSTDVCKINVLKGSQAKKITATHKNGEKINFNSLKEAAEYVGTNVGHISNCLHKKKINGTSLSAKGFTFNFS